MIVAVVGLGWLRAQLRPPRPANDDLGRPDGESGVHLGGGAVAGAVVSDVKALPGVVAAAARIWGDSANPDVYLRVDTREGAAVQELLDRIERKSLDRLRQALHVKALTTHLDLRVAEPAGRTIR